MACLALACLVCQGCLCSDEPFPKNLDSMFSKVISEIIWHYNAYFQVWKTASDTSCICTIVILIVSNTLIILQYTDDGSTSLPFAGFGQTQTQPIGHKCLICKRDLSFTPEGPVFMPAIRPVVAVLPCGHTFHDHCLRLITPEEEVKNPPCIPCAIGESWI